MSENPAIVVSAYNRSMPLYRLLQSIAQAKYSDEKITLVISIDKSDTRDIGEVAESFEWKYGEKRIIQHPTHLGLKEHILSCGDFTNKFDAIIVLEDDLLVSPYFYEYAKQALEFYENEKDVAGISLYNYQVAESCFYPFKAIDDGSDVYFMQVASSWGQVWTKKQWGNFRNWFEQNTELPSDASIPDYLKLWGKHSWKKHFIHYLIDTNKYFVFPRLSLTTNFEEEGTNSHTKNVFHVPLQISELNFSFQSIEHSKSIYDGWFEITPKSLSQHAKQLSQYDYEVDLYGTKKAFQKRHVLTSKHSRNPLQTYSFELFPLETNIALNLNGSEIGLYETTGSIFENGKLRLRNFLEEVNLDKDLNVSIIIPMKELNRALVKKTLDSIEQQTYPFCEVIIVASKENKTEIEKLVSYYTFGIKFVESEHAQLDQQVLVGFNTAKGDILTWVYQGAEFKTNTIKNVNTIFKSYATINWISGIQEDTTDKYKYDRLDVFNYRIAPIELYKRAKNNTLNYSTENHFYRSGCLKTISVQNFDLKKLYFHLIDNYQLIVVVKCLVKSENENIDFNLGKEDVVQLLHKYKPSASIATRKAKLFGLLLRTRFIGHASYKWYYTVLHNFPDVLRYDFENKTFYLSKH